jgi:hypothetical protein
MSIFTTWLADDALVAYFDAGAPSDPATSWAALLEVVTDGEAGTVTEASYSGYGRVQISGKFAAPAAGLNGRSITTNAAVTFGQKGDAGTDTQIALGIYDASTAGNLMAIVYLDGADPFAATAAASGDLWTAYAHGLIDDDQVRISFIAGSPDPTGATEDTSYYVDQISVDTFTLGTTPAFGTPITITQDGAALIMPLSPKDVTQDDTPEFASGAIEVGLD